MADAFLSDAELFARLSAFCCFALLVGILVYAARSRRWPELEDVLLSLLAMAGMTSGIRIILVTLLASQSALGPIANDRIALFLGGAVLLLFAARSGARSVRRAAHL